MMGRAVTIVLLGALSMSTAAFAAVTAPPAPHPEEYREVDPFSRLRANAKLPKLPLPDHLRRHLRQNGDAKAVTTHQSNTKNGKVGVHPAPVNAGEEIGRENVLP